jgi:hypothetical protein
MIGGLVRALVPKMICIITGASLLLLLVKYPIISSYEGFISNFSSSSSSKASDYFIWLGFSLHFVCRIIAYTLQNRNTLLVNQVLDIFICFIPVRFFYMGFVSRHAKNFIGYRFLSHSHFSFISFPQSRQLP